MRHSNEKSKGIAACEIALQRLLNGTPEVSAHVGIELRKITAGIVSVEAGFDRGYLKKSRPSHRSLLAKISSLKDAPQVSLKDTDISKLRQQLETIQAELDAALQQRDSVLVQNLQLWERISALESELPSPPTPSPWSYHKEL